ncbi:helix-turn-helix domain-containing protein [Stenomitos frigidus]|uniref:Transposase n=1 Tax=Stenomitos frigidus ULC18 TaxID=2107698 RepID=A0A2T1EAA4_9CYAN|nr:helix-turn-helix domain-containing protein [Stenomitos frigidus]PSB29638.1 hypothetical protein C7B82_10745 [Stenomitos frigidus ULC18]
MTSRKLSESDKQEILQLYRQPGETTSTLASRYGVSNSTISRILKTSFSEAEYDALIQTKRGNRTSSETPSLLDVDPGIVDAEVAGFESVVDANEKRGDLEESFATEATVAEAIGDSIQESLSVTAPLEETLPSALTANGRRLRKRSSTPPAPMPFTPIIAPPTVAPPPFAPPTVKIKSLEADRSPIADRDDTALPVEDISDIDAEPLYDELLTAGAAEGIVMGEDLLQDEADLADELDDDDDDLDDDDLDDDELDDDDLDDDLENGALFAGGRIAGKALVQVLPLAEASLPRTCYLVVDRSAELIARPLKEFGDLGQIPEAEILSKTLPVFDNHRVAKRYSNPRTQRVIKLPDAQVLQKTSSHLQAKGITRLLIDGQVYAL